MPEPRTSYLLTVAAATLHGRLSRDYRLNKLACHPYNSFCDAGRDLKQVSLHHTNKPSSRDTKTKKKL